MNEDDRKTLIAILSFFLLILLVVAVGGTWSSHIRRVDCMAMAGLPNLNPVTFERMCNN